MIQKNPLLLLTRQLSTTSMLASMMSHLLWMLEMVIPSSNPLLFKSAQYQSRIAHRLPCSSSELKSILSNISKPAFQNSGLSSGAQIYVRPLTHYTMLLVALSPLTLSSRPSYPMPMLIWPRTKLTRRIWSSLSSYMTTLSTTISKHATKKNAKCQGVWEQLMRPACSIRADYEYVNTLFTWFHDVELIYLQLANARCQFLVENNYPKCYHDLIDS